MQLFDISDERKRALLQQLGVLHSLSVRLHQLRIEDLLLSARVHCLSKVGTAFASKCDEQPLWIVIVRSRPPLGLPPPPPP
jgi:hypothetical protein